MEGGGEQKLKKKKNRGREKEWKIKIWRILNIIKENQIIFL